MIGVVGVTLAVFRMGSSVGPLQINSFRWLILKKEKIKKIENFVKEKEKSECGRCVRADFFALLWGLMGS